MILKNKKSQIAIFVIIGIVIVFAILLFFFLRSNVLPSVSESPEKNPEFFLSSCLEEKVDETIKIISNQGGYISNQLNKSIDGIEISYLCYTNNFYTPCINQEPMWIEHLRGEIEKNIQDEFEKCFQELKTELIEKGYNVNLENYMEVQVNLAPKKVIIEAKRDLILEKSGETRKFEDYKFNKASRLYDLAVIAQEIVSQEAEFCNFNSQGFMLLYPTYEIEKFRTGDGTIIYLIQDKKTKDIFRFAVRSCVSPGGL